MVGRKPVEASALSLPTVLAAGLPTGVNLVRNSTTGSWSLTGRPTVASRTDKAGNFVPSKVKLTVTTAGRTKRVFALNWTILPLPAWAAGTFDGEAGGVFSATVIGKSGRDVVTNAVAVSSALVDDVEVGVASGDIAAGDNVLITPLSWSACQNLWKRSDTKASMPVFKKSVAKALEIGEAGDANNTLNLTFKAGGAVSFAGKVLGVNVSGSSQLVYFDDSWRVTLYAPAKKGFAGWCMTIAVDLMVDKSTNVVTDVTME